MNASTGTTLSAVEGQLLVALDALLGLGRGDALLTPARLNPVRRELLLVGRDRIARAVVRHLVDDGGYRERTLLRDGARVTGRAWDAALGRGFTPRYTAASLHLWLEAARELPERVAQAASAAAASADAESRSKKTMRTVVDTSGTDTGDWVFYHLALRNLPETYGREMDYVDFIWPQQVSEERKEAAASMREKREPDYKKARQKAKKS